MSHDPADETAAAGAGRGRVLVTGASGYIGWRLISVARAAGFDVVAGARVPERLPFVSGVEVRRFDLVSRVGLDDLVAGIDAVVHLAAVIGTRARRANEEGPNLAGTRRLLEAARRQGVRRFLFLSSRSAAPDAITDYGRDKWAIEGLLTGVGEIVVRPGMVIGGPRRGVYGQLVRLCRRSTWLPIVRRRAPVYPVHLDDLCGLLVEILGRHGPLPRRIKLAPAGSLHLGACLRSVARLRLGRRLRLLPLPAWPIAAVCRLSRRVSFLSHLPCERILGLIALPPMPAEPSAMDLGLQTPIRALDVALFPEGLRRRLLREGAVLLRYVLGRPPAVGALRRYARAVTDHPGAAPLDLPGPVVRWPCLLRLIEPFHHDPSSALHRRLSLAMRIAEMTTAAAPRFHVYQRRSRWVAVTALVWAACVEALLLPCRWIFGRAGRRVTAARGPSDGRP